MYEDSRFWRSINSFIEHHVLALLVWFFVSVAIGLVASARGRSLPGWFAISLLVSPVIATVLLLFVVPPIHDGD